MNRLTVLAGFASLSLVASASAQTWLSGVVTYSSFSDGSAASEPAEYDNIVGTNNSELIVNGAARGTTFALTPGVNNFTTRYIPGYQSFSLYFSSTSAAFSRPFASAPDLVVYGYTNIPLTPAAGIAVQNNGQFSGTSPYSGATTFTIGNQELTVTGIGINVGGTNTSNSFQITVREIPAPGALGLLGVAGLLASRRRRA
ncbi:MAG: hypothetical protein K2X32_04160 [Phycisphaerales bacterium]|nr:hypothetical protein [Phycisphaerales bacterium]